MSPLTSPATPTRDAGAKTGSSTIQTWDVEDPAFWESTGKRIAYRNLWLSVPALLCGFAVWGMWGIVTVQMLNLGFPFTQAELFTLTAIAQNLRRPVKESPDLSNRHCYLHPLCPEVRS